MSDIDRIDANYFGGISFSSLQSFNPDEDVIDNIMIQDVDEISFKDSGSLGEQSFNSEEYYFHSNQLDFFIYRNLKSCSLSNFRM